MLVFLLSACKSGTVASEVDFSLEKEVQIHYNDVLIDSSMSFDGESLFLLLKNVTGNNDDVEVKINSTEYKINYQQMSFDGDVKELSQDYLPLILFEYFKTNGNMISFSEYDRDSDSYITESNAIGSFIKFEMIKNESEKHFFSLYIA